ncbi:MAG TPA: GDSL-type esterase/lipase family protein [bacterium]|nr:GDSL-type esterase/lipase family protein [bacterium]HQI48441.1 GDSL-type esterase/lipase family protein [bacterium]HQJ63903.1 GDSL-type esterase/lipase family protein [bacterium]
MRKGDRHTRRNPLSPSRKRLFWVLLVALPVLFLLLLEGGLRLLHYGGEDDLVLLRKEYGERYYQINRQVARRYFGGGENTIPDARGEAFAYIKTPETYRIFCLGGSTTAGWPFQHNAGFPSQLQVRLARLFPQRNFEVINVGISAINSYSVLDFTRELLRYQPDLFLIYMGHNEFYGALGAASTRSIGLSRPLIKVYMRLERLRLLQLLRDGLNRLRRAPAAAGPHETLMESMVGDKKILLDSPKYRRARADFAANLGEILAMIHKKGVPVLVSTLVSNIADQPPFESPFSPGFHRESEWNTLVQQGDTALNRKDPAVALTWYRQAAALDSLPALIVYKMGQCQRLLGDSLVARRQLERARDLDALRFRASSDFNEVIRSVCRSQQTPVVETEAAFIQAAPQGLVGHTLMLDHLHPGAPGYLLMADAFCRAMAAHDLIVPAAQWPWARDPAPEEMLAQACVTPLEEEIAYQRIRILTSRYPFREEHLIKAVAEPEYERVLQGAVQMLFQRKWSWSEAHYRVADWLTGKQRYAEAAQEYRAVIRVVPGNYYPYLFLGTLLTQMGKDNEAEAALLQAAACSPNLPFAYAKLGVYYMNRNEADKAMPVLKQAIALAGNSRDFTRQDLSRVHYLLGVALAQRGDYAGARSEARIALNLAPGEARVLKLQQQLDAAGAP